MSSFSRNSNLDSFIALALWIEAISFFLRLRKLFQVYDILLEIVNLLVLVLRIGCTEFNFQNLVGQKSEGF